MCVEVLSANLMAWLNAASTFETLQAKVLSHLKTIRLTSGIHPYLPSKTTAAVVVSNSNVLIDRRLFADNCFVEAVYVAHRA